MSIILKYSKDYSDILYSLSFLTIPFTSSIAPEGITLIDSNQKVHTGLTEILYFFKELTLCDNADINFINQNFQFLDSKKIEVADNLKMSINMNNYYNKKNLTMADTYLFSKCYKKILEGVKLNERIAEWFKRFQEEASKNFLFDKIESDSFKFMELRVGKINNICDHPESEKLYKEDVFIDHPITVLSGLKEIVEKNELLGNNYLFVTNLKHVKMAGIISEAMILCVKDEDGNIEPIKVNQFKEGDVAVLENQALPLVPGISTAILKSADPRFVGSFAHLKVEDHCLMWKNSKIIINGVEISTVTKKGKVS